MAKKKIRRKRRSFTPEFRAEAARLVKSTGKSVGQIAKELDLTETALREWVRKAEQPGGEPLTADEREELKRLRKDVHRLRMEREILRKAAFFAKENS